jgi:hypothetical protein
LIELHPVGVAFRFNKKISANGEAGTEQKRKKKEKFHCEKQKEFQVTEAMPRHRMSNGMNILIPTPRKK